MSRTVTKYFIVDNTDRGNYRKAVAEHLDAGYTLVASWVVHDSVHHVLSIQVDEEAK